MHPSTQHHHPADIDTTAHLDAVVVGAGFGGLYALHKLRELGLKVRAYERGDDVGGTWYWNRYPGLHCDIETQSYSFNFDQEMFNGWRWSSRFAPQAEILEYARYVADTLDLRDDIAFGTSIVSAHYDETRAVWRLTLDDGDVVTATYFLPAVGILCELNIPQMPGMENFEGSIYHTANWPAEQIDLTGRRVGVIGTGSSGVQLVCALSPAVGELRVFQRTAQYVTPARQRRLSDAEVQVWKSTLPELRERMRSTAFCALGTTAEKSVHDDSPDERLRVFEEAWESGAQAITDASYNDIAIDKAANEIVADFVKGKIRATVEDPRTAEKLIPNYYFKTRRPVIADGYYEAFNRDNVHLVDVKATPIHEFTPKGIRTADGTEHELDVIVFATGYDGVTGGLFNMDIRGRGGASLKEAWDGGARVRSYLGVNTNGFPNMFPVQGPMSPGVATSYICGVEVNVDFITGFIDHLRRNDIVAAEADETAESAWTARVQQIYNSTLLPHTESWWNGSNVDGKARYENYAVFLGGISAYQQFLAAEIESGYSGFVTSHHAAVV
ncbi:flavin-containing monooxygenase [Rhodococcus sp. NPDC057529]|uniref:flavin-containing monooxygenase n=1 Tax=Rhodococcus sp. NPDC057529 TaxID=3346158 RepID=UPI00366F6DBD